MQHNYLLIDTNSYLFKFIGVGGCTISLPGNPFYEHGITLNPVWINSYIHYKV